MDETHDETRAIANPAKNVRLVRVHATLKRSSVKAIKGTTVTTSKTQGIVTVRYAPRKRVAPIDDETSSTDF